MNGDAVAAVYRPDVLALAVLIVNIAGLVALAVRGEASGHDILAIVGLADATVGVIALVRALSVVRHAHPGRSLGGSAVALGLVTLLFLPWPDPIFAAARLVAPSSGQTVGEGFIAILAASWAILTGLAIASLLRPAPRRSA